MIPTGIVWQSGGSGVRSGLNAKASRQRKFNFEGGNRGPNSDNPISTVTYLSPANRGSGRPDAPGVTAYAIARLITHHHTIEPWSSLFTASFNSTLSRVNSRATAFR